MKRVDRIRKMEECFDVSGEALDGLEAALDKLESTGKAYKRLVRYYDGVMWRRDFEADEAGKLPDDLKRGVLSEDGVWDLIERRRKLLERMNRILKKE